MTKYNISVTDRLTPEEKQKILKELRGFWHGEKPNKEGWVDLRMGIYPEPIRVNVRHGGYKSFHTNESGDIVNLVGLVLFENPEGGSEAIEWIYKTLGWNGRSPKLPPNRKFPKDKLAGKEENFTMVPNSILKNKVLKPSTKNVWAAIFERCGGNKNYSFAGIRTIAKDLGVTPRTVSRAIEELKEHNLLFEEDRENSRSKNRYPLVNG